MSFVIAVTAVITFTGTTMLWFILGLFHTRSENEFFNLAARATDLAERAAKEVLRLRKENQELKGKLNVETI